MQNGITNPQPGAPSMPVPGAPMEAGKQGWMAKMQPSPWLLHKLILLAILVAVGVGAFCWGRSQRVDAKDSTKELLEPTEYGKRVVARLFNDQVAVTREELGEYLIARFGPDRIEFMINRKIVEMECRKHNIFATDAEVEQRLEQDLKSFGSTAITRQEFANTILRRFGKTLYEWKEDVIRPKIMMEKFVRSSIKITEADVKEGFDARYGPKVECRMIVCDGKSGRNLAMKTWENARKGSAYFLEEARKQFIPNLAANEGKVPAIHKHFGDQQIESTAFRLKEGEIGPLLEMKDGSFVILMCEKHLPANIAVRYEDVRTELAKEMEELRLAQRIPDVFAEMRKRATVKVVLDNSGTPSSPVSAPGPDPLPIAPQANVKPIQIPPPPTPGEVKGPEGVPPLPAPPMLVPVPVPMPPAPTPPAPMATPMPPVPMLPVPTPPAPVEKK